MPLPERGHDTGDTSRRKKGRMPKGMVIHLRKLSSSVACRASYYKTIAKLNLQSDAKVLWQGITGRASTFHCARAIEFGTDVVGGISKSRAGQRHLGVPVFGSVRDALAAVKPDACATFVPPLAAKDAILEAIEAEIGLICCVTEGIPQKDQLIIRAALESQSVSRYVGANTAGIVNTKGAKMGIHPKSILRAGNVGIISKSGTVSYECAHALVQAGLGQSKIIGIGGDVVLGTTHLDAVRALMSDEDTHGIALCGEIGGYSEDQVADWILEHEGKLSKPIVAFIAGVNAPQNQLMGHAGAYIWDGVGLAKSKIDILEKAGCRIASNVAEIGALMCEALGMTRT